jgi:hypothetical protein
MLFAPRHNGSPIPAGNIPLVWSDTLVRDLRGFWPLTDGGGTLTIDLSPYNSAGTFTNTPTWEDGAFGKAMGVTGGSYSALGSAGWLAFGAPHSYSAWVYPTASQYGSIYAGENGGPQFRRNSDTTITLNRQNAVSGGASTGTVANNTWTHVGVSYDGTTVRYYINGAASGTASATLSYTNYNSRRIGTAANNEHFAGRIQNVRIYSRVLTEEEFWGLFENPWRGVSARKRFWPSYDTGNAGILPFLSGLQVGS